MTIAYMEVMDSFTTAGAGGGWTNYDIFTSKSVPKGAIVEIIATNVLDGAEDYVGVRTDGSSLERRLLLHEAEDGGFVTARFLATVNSSTGLIEYYDTGQSQTYYIVGYWTGITVTETWIDLNVVKVDESIWVDRDLYTSDGIPKGSVCLASLVNRATGNDYRVGVRTDGSSIYNRYRAVGEAEGGGDNVVSMFVKTSVADGIIEIYCEDQSPNCSVIIQGYFDSSIDFQENFPNIENPGFTGWRDVNYSNELDENGRIIDMIILNNIPTAETLMGVRENDSSLNRYIEEHESEGGITGFGMSVQTDSYGIIELYVAVAYNTHLQLTGYFKPTTGPPTGFRKLQYFSEPPTGGAFNKLRFAVEPPVSAAWNKILYENE